MKRLGTQINEDGKTVWRNNGGIIERKAMYAQKPAWETVADAPETPRTPAELKAFCEKHGFGYEIKKQFRFKVDVAYDCRLGDRGDIVSRHTTYEFARAAAKRSGYDSFLAVREINE